PAVEPCPEWMTGDLGEKYIAFINFYIHQVNLIRFLLEEDFELEHVDGGEMVLVARSSSGVTVVLEMNTHALQGDWLEEYVAHFDRGLITMSLPAPMARQDTGKVSVYRHREEGAIVEQPQIDLAWSMTEQAKRFVEEVRGEQPNVSPPEDAARDLEIAEAYIRLVQKGRSK
ncbi:MAG: hypothetical protein JJU11_09740, partial [Candidatus Sumerlaeia bacterium]|nr:hypothetical protein [Candidatus Sumerlaeia bacterium]